MSQRYSHCCAIHAGKHPNCLPFTQHGEGLKIEVVQQISEVLHALNEQIYEQGHWHCCDC